MKTHHSLGKKLAVVALLASIGLISTATVNCGGGASCDAVCSNVIDKCDSGSALTDGGAERNACLETCSERVQTVPDSCASDRDLLLSCLSDAPSINCNDPQASAACTMANSALDACAGHKTTSESSVSVGAGGSGASCTQDKTCPTGLCNTNTQQCGTPGALAAPCYRDTECAGSLCNTNTEQCATAGALGGPCYRDDECANALCNTKTEQCAAAGALGGPCYRDDECSNNLCNTKSEQCETAGALGSPCYRAQECQSNSCNGQSCN
jgi:hypothetical protein